MNELIKREDAIRALLELSIIDCINKHDAVGKCVATIIGLPSADRPQGHWTKTDAATYRCSECGKIQIADDANELNFCCCCGSRNKVRRKGADDE